MKRQYVTMLAAVAVWSVLLTGASAVAQSRTPGSAHAGTSAASSGTWGSAKKLPGLAALNVGAFAGVNVVSCASPGNCSAAGFFTDSSGNSQAFIANQANGTWHAAQEIPGMATLDAGGGSGPLSLSCPSAGNCSVGGFAGPQAFVDDETNGTWGTAEAVPGIAALNLGGSAEATSISCPSAGNCAAGGSYMDGSFHTQAFVVDETGGTWGNAQEVPGTAALNVGDFASATAVSCPSAGNCATVGFYGDVSDEFHRQVFVADETNGTWGNAEQIPGTAALNDAGDAQATSVSCPSAGNCAAGGFYANGSGQQVFVVDETNGTWGNAEEVPGTAALNKGQQAAIASVSCTSAGHCTAGGWYDTKTARLPFVVNEKNGTWGKAKQVPGIAALNVGKAASITSLSCGAAGNCSAGGMYLDAAKKSQAFVVSSTNGTWGTAEEVPGSATLNAGGSAEITSVSCSSANHCSAGGTYASSSTAQQAFVVGRT
jgi:hypothetical protein